MTLDWGTRPGWARFGERRDRSRDGGVVLVKRIALLGSTGSIGRQTLEVVEHAPERFEIVGLGAGRNVALLQRQVARFHPRVVAVRDAADCGAVAAPPEVLYGAEGLEALATMPEADVIVVATSGHWAIGPTLAALRAGKDVALANKETIVCAGELVRALAGSAGMRLRPIDSEHSALWQALGASDDRVGVARLILTGSGGPFRERPAAEFANISIQDALAHPTWPAMGGKLTIDSATLMNKGLEAIEASWLFGVPLTHIDVLINPQSIVHGLVQYADGSMLAHLASPDMRLPIAYALGYPLRLDLPWPAVDLTRVGRLDFAKPDMERFPCLRLAYQAGGAGGLYPTVLSAADDAAVAAFLAGAIGFTRIASTIAATLDAFPHDGEVTVEAIVGADRWSRDFVRARLARP